MSATGAVPAVPDPELIAELVLGHPAVAGLHRGPFGVVASYLPGRRIDGVRLAADGSGVELAVTVRFGERIPAVAQQLRALVRELAGDIPVHVMIADVADVMTADTARADVLTADTAGADALTAHAAGAQHDESPVEEAR